MKQEPSGLAGTFNLNMRMVFGVCCAVVIFARSASAQVLPTVAVYDESNAVEIVATGSTLDLKQFKQDVAAAFQNDFGGVFQCNAVGGDVGPYNFSYGASQKKVLNMTGGIHNRIGVTSSAPSVRSISGIGLWENTTPDMTFFMDNLTSSVPDEAVVEFGLTILSTSFFDMGDVTATARFSDGSEASAQCAIGKGTGSGDTFFGFKAPDGQSIVNITFTNSAGRQMFLDDIGFITASRPYRLHIPR